MSYKHMTISMKLYICKSHAILWFNKLIYNERVSTLKTSILFWSDSSKFLPEISLFI